MNDYLSLGVGIVCAACGGELFVRGAVGLAQWARVSAGIIGATVAAFATSAPESSVAVQSALAGRPELALGDALGSNVVNVGLVLGVALVISPLRANRADLRRDFSAALLVPLLTAGLCLDGVISRVDAGLLLAVFGGWLIATVREARRQRRAATAGADDAGAGRWADVGRAGAGFLLLLLAGNRIVAGAAGLATSWGMDEFVVGATLVAFGTSVPELATVIIARYRGHDEVGLGAVLGSNIFNGLFVVGTAAAIHPIRVSGSEIIAALGFGLVMLGLAYPTVAGLIGRGRGAALLGCYAVYVAVVLSGAPH